MFSNKYVAQIWFLSYDAAESARFQTRKSLARSISGCIQALVTSCFYADGIRNKKFYDYYFDKQRKDETMAKLFPGWSSSRKPSFNKYSSKTSKWCRQCKEHFDYVLIMLRAFLDEYQFRAKKLHQDEAVYEWFLSNSSQVKIPYAKLKSLDLPWKVLKPQYRCKDIVAGYRRQFMHCFIDSYSKAIYEYSNVNRNVPQFILDFYQLDIN